MSPTLYERLKTIAVVMVVIEGVFLLVLISVDVWLTYRSVQETETNREISCISRFLDDERYAPECEPIIAKYVESRR